MMSATTKDTAKDLISRWVARVVPPGFSRATALTWIEDGNGVSRVLEVRRVDRNQDDVIRLSVEFGFYVPGFAERAWPSIGSRHITAASGPYTGRIGRFLQPPSDLWWFVRGSTVTRVTSDARSLKDLSDDECSRLVSERIVPLLRTVSSPSDLVRKGPEYRSLGLLSLNMALKGDSYEILRAISGSAT